MAETSLLNGDDKITPSSVSVVPLLTRPIQGYFEMNVFVVSGKLDTRYSNGRGCNLDRRTSLLLTYPIPGEIERVFTSVKITMRKGKDRKIYLYSLFDQVDVFHRLDKYTGLKELTKKFLQFIVVTYVFLLCVNSTTSYTNSKQIRTLRVR